MGKKIYKEGYKDAYIKSYSGHQYYGFGVLAKLISSCCRRITMKTRLIVVNEIAKERGIEGNIKKEDFLKPDDRDRPIHDKCTPTQVSK